MVNVEVAVYLIVNGHSLVTCQAYPNVKRRLVCGFRNSVIILKEGTYKRLESERQILKEITVGSRRLLVYGMHLDVVKFQRLIAIIAHPCGKRGNVILKSSRRNRNIVRFVNTAFQHYCHGFKRGSLGSDT